MQLEDVLFRQKEKRGRSAEFVTFESKRLKAWKVTAGRDNIVLRSCVVRRAGGRSSLLSYSRIKDSGRR